MNLTNVNFKTDYCKCIKVHVGTGVSAPSTSSYYEETLKEVCIKEKKYDNANKSRDINKKRKSAAK